MGTSTDEATEPAERRDRGLLRSRAMRWVVLFTDNTEETIEVPALTSAMSLDYLARDKARALFPRKRPFASRPQGCTGLAYNVHCGRACPIHTHT